MTLQKMIIVDDEIWIARSLAELLDWNKEGYEIAGVFTDSGKALECIRELEPALILLDIRMPVISGERIMEILQEEGIRSNIIIISAYSDFSVAQKAIACGAAGYILKPIDGNELLETVRRISKEYLHTVLTDWDCQTAHSLLMLPKTVGNIKSYIDQNYSKELTLNFLSSQFYLTPSYISDIFKKSTGYTITSYIQKVRMEKAAQLFLTEDMSLVEIAGMVGYDDYNYFCRLFKRSFNMSPHAYRRAQLSNDV